MQSAGRSLREASDAETTDAEDEIARVELENQEQTHKEALKRHVQQAAKDEKEAERKAEKEVAEQEHARLEVQEEQERRAVARAERMKTEAEEEVQARDEMEREESRKRAGLEQEVREAVDEKQQATDEMAAAAAVAQMQLVVDAAERRRKKAQELALRAVQMQQKRKAEQQAEARAEAQVEEGIKDEGQAERTGREEMAELTDQTAQEVGEKEEELADKEDKDDDGDGDGGGGGGDGGGGGGDGDGGDGDGHGGGGVGDGNYDSHEPKGIGNTLMLLAGQGLIEPGKHVGDLLAEGAEAAKEAEREADGGDETVEMAAQAERSQQSQESDEEEIVNTLDYSSVLGDLQSEDESVRTDSAGRSLSRQSTWSVQSVESDLQRQTVSIDGKVFSTTSDFRMLLEEVYAAYDPSKIGQIPEMLCCWEEEEAALVDKLRMEYPMHFTSPVKHAVAPAVVSAVAPAVVSAVVPGVEPGVEPREADIRYDVDEDEDAEGDDPSDDPSDDRSQPAPPQESTFSPGPASISRLLLSGADFAAVPTDIATGAGVGVHLLHLGASYGLGRTEIEAIAEAKAMSREARLRAPPATEPETADARVQRRLNIQWSAQGQWVGVKLEHMRTGSGSGFQTGVSGSGGGGGRGGCSKSEKAAYTIPAEPEEQAKQEAEDLEATKETEEEAEEARREEKLAQMRRRALDQALRDAAEEDKQTQQESEAPSPNDADAPRQSRQCVTIGSRTLVTTLDYQELLEKIYAEHSPSKLEGARIAQILEEWQGEEQALVDGLGQKYKEFFAVMTCARPDEKGEHIEDLEQLSRQQALEQALRDAAEEEREKERERERRKEWATEQEERQRREAQTVSKGDTDIGEDTELITLRHVTTLHANISPLGPSRQSSAGVGGEGKFGGDTSGDGGGRASSMSNASVATTASDMSDSQRQTVSIDGKVFSTTSDFRMLLEEVYAAYDPSKIGQIPEMLCCWEEEEAALVDKLRMEYPMHFTSPEKVRQEEEMANYRAREREKQRSESPAVQRRGRTRNRQQLKSWSASASQRQKVRIRIPAVHRSLAAASTRQRSNSSVSNRSVSSNRSASNSSRVSDGPQVTESIFSSNEIDPSGGFMTLHLQSTADYRELLESLYRRYSPAKLKVNGGHGYSPGFSYVDQQLEAWEGEELMLVDKLKMYYPEFFGVKSPHNTPTRSPRSPGTAETRIEATGAMVAPPMQELELNASGKKRLRVAIGERSFGTAAEYRALLRGLYTKHNYAQLSKVEALLEAWHGEEAALLEKLEVKYPSYFAELITEQRKKSGFKVKVVSEDELRQFFELHAPEKAANVEKVMLMFAGRDEMLMEMLRTKYGTVPASASASITASASASITMAASLSNPSKPDTLARATTARAPSVAAAARAALSKPFASFSPSALLPSSPSSVSSLLAGSPISALSSSSSTSLAGSPGSQDAASAPTGDALSKSSTVQAFTREELIEFMHVYAPEKITNVDTIMSTFAGRDEVLLAMFQQKYGAVPPLPPDHTGTQHFVDHEAEQVLHVQHPMSMVPVSTPAHAPTEFAA
jgi:hypothetical protein